MKRLIRIWVPNDQGALGAVSNWLERAIRLWRSTPNTERQILRSIVTGLRGVEQETEQERIADTLVAAVAAGKEVLDSLVAVLAGAEKETLEEADARLDPAATAERLRGFAERLGASKPLCSMVYIKQEEEKGSIGCLQTARFVVSGPCSRKREKQYACGCHLMQTVEEMMEEQEGVAHVEAV